MKSEEVEVPSELAPGVILSDAYVGGNVGLIASERGALLVDTPMLPPQARHWHSVIEELGAGPAYGIVNTDHHPEHYLGNAHYMPARVFGHEESYRQVAKYETSLLEQLCSAYRKEDPALAEELAHSEITWPEVCVGDRLTLHLGDREVVLMHLPGHTPASLGVYLPADGILFAGDNVVNDEHPTMYQADTEAWLHTLDAIAALNPKMIVPGSGAPCTVQVLAPLGAYIREMRVRVQALFDEGVTRRECVDKVGMLDAYPVPEDQATRIRRRRRENVERVYTEVRSAEKKRRDAA